MVTLRWLGAAGLECSTEQQTVLIDPYLSRASKRQLLLGHPTPDRARIKRYLQALPAPLSAILIGHTHVDHALDVPAFARHLPGRASFSPPHLLRGGLRGGALEPEGPLPSPPPCRSQGRGCTIVGSRSLDTILKAHGLPNRVQVCRGGETLSLAEGLTVTMMTSAHGRVALGRVPYPGEVPPNLRPPLRTRAYRHGTVFAIVVEVGGQILMHLGSAHLPRALGRHRCDILCACVSGWKRIPSFVPRLLDALQPKVVVPFHWDDFTVPLRDGEDPPRIPFVDLEGFTESVARHAPQVQIERPRILKPIVL